MLHEQPKYSRNFSSPESVIPTNTTYSFGEREVLTSLEGEWKSTMFHFTIPSSCSWGMFGSVGCSRLLTFRDDSGEDATKKLR